MSEDESTAPAPLTAKTLYARFGGGLVPVITTDSLGDEHIGSAFHVGDGAFVTARHVVDGQVSCRVELDSYRLRQLADGAAETLMRLEGQQWEIQAHPHPDPGKDVAVFSLPALASLPVIPLGDHLDDWIRDHDFVLNEVLVLGFPPIPLAKKNVLVASRGQINAVVDLINIEHVHFIVSATARGGFSGGVVLSEWGFALGVVTSSLVKNGAVEELGYLTVLTVEPILQCLADNALLPRHLAEQWEGLFTAQTEYFGVPENRWAHSWLETDRDGHRARVSFATPDPAVVAAANAAVLALKGVAARHEVIAVDVHVWELEGEYHLTEAPLDLVRITLRETLLAQGYLPVDHPTVVDRTLDQPFDPWL